MIQGPHQPLSLSTFLYKLVPPPTFLAITSLLSLTRSLQEEEEDKMEKYTQFRDKATGISPFMPIVGASSSTPHTLLTTPPKLVLVLVRIALSLPFVLLAFITIPIHPLHTSFLRLVLFIYGLSNAVDVSVQGIKKTQDTKLFSPVRHEVYFVNFSSPLDYFILSILSKDAFVVLIPNESGQLQKYNAWSFIQRALGSSNDNGEDFALSELNDKVIYIFPEGTTTNNKAIIPFTITESQWKLFYSQLTSSSSSSSSSKIYKLKTLSMKLSPSQLTTPLALMWYQYLYRALSQWSFHYRVRINFVEDNQSLLKVKDAFAYNGRFKLVEGVGLKEKREFIKVFKGRK